MTRFATLLTAAAILAGPAAAQYYPQPYPQPYPYPQQYPQQYPQSGYPYPGYPQNQGVIGQIVDQLLGNRYSVSERQAVRSCAVAAMQRAQLQYGRYGNPYGGQYPPGYNGQYPRVWQGYPGTMQVTAITDVQRRSSATLRVRGLLDSGRYRNRYNYRTGVAGDLSFRCDVNYSGYVSNVRIDRRY